MLPCYEAWPFLIGFNLWALGYNITYCASILGVAWFSKYMINHHQVIVETFCGVSYLPLFTIWQNCQKQDGCHPIYFIGVLCHHLFSKYQVSYIHLKLNLLLYSCHTERSRTGQIFNMYLNLSFTQL